MNCLKCGKETDEPHVFCDSCLEVMQAYPVKPGTAVHIPPQALRSADKKLPVRRRTLTPKEQLRQLRSLIRWLTITIAVLSVVLCLTAGLLIYTLDNQAKPNTIGSYPGTNTSTQP